MKKQYAIAVAFIISLSAFYSSCTDKMNKSTGALEFDNVRLNESVHLFGDTAKPGARLIIDYVYVTKSSDETLKDFLNNFFISACFDEKYADMEAKEAIDQYAETYTTDYRIDLEPMFLEDQKNNDRNEEYTVASWYDYYQNIESAVQLYQGDLLVYRVNFNEFTGGAHGMHRTNFLNIDLKMGYQLFLDDIFQENTSELISQLLWQQLISDNKAASQEELELMGYGLTGDLVPTENFYLDKDGIAFYYNVYEVAPYSMGPVEIKLSYSKLDHLMKDVKIISELRKQA